MQKGKPEMANLNEVEKFYINEHSDISSEDIANKMRKVVTPEIVQAYRDNIESTSGSAMSRNPEKGVAIMTEVASSASDFIEKSDRTKLADKAKKTIHRIQP